MQASKWLLRSKKAKDTIPHTCLGMGWEHLHNCVLVLGPNETWWEVPHVVSGCNCLACLHLCGPESKPGSFLYTYAPMSCHFAHLTIQTEGQGVSAKANVPSGHWAVSGDSFCCCGTANFLWVVAWDELKLVTHTQQSIVQPKMSTADCRRIKPSCL